MPTAYVTGAAGGLGTAITDALVSDGYSVAMFDIDRSQLQDLATRHGDAVRAFEADVSDAASVDAAVTAAEAAFGPCELLVNNAGTFSVCAPMWECDPDLWQRDVRINLIGTFLMCNRVTGGMVDRKLGRVINIVSSGGVLDGHPYGTSYAASKTGTTRITEGLAIELAEHGCQAFAVGPPAVATAMTKWLVEDGQARTYRPLIKEIFERGEDHPPSVVADCVLALASGRADRLSGRYFLPHEDYEAVIDAADEVLDRDLWALRITGHEKG
ncbi:SDR family NAD(P)-dependent oxidoreductase [Oceanomicrobium pacificus]|uniref:SDR family NAD(P)-dependent oxidoreductase n=1 Tax=Oceanomicrobium pacificus TaxID=2692916 RepID=A0A6B0TTV7_9RHOB|nr:SDR family NAD(P)-dependent oxidoreductase [Oceanomicrobium pacificus]MXU64393.1 SDR family NAD(P)-dependent oxidoreductase [Oceanomicrobium pacificus]